MAKELNHDKIYAVDWMEKGAGTRGAGEIFEYAEKNQPELFNELMKNIKFIEEADKGQKISDIFRIGNSVEYISKGTETYVNMARIGANDDYFGLGWLIWWYQRNLIIFANLMEIISGADDKIMLLIGSSHTGILNGFLRDSGMVDVVLAADYL